MIPRVTDEPELAPNYWVTVSSRRPLPTRHVGQCRPRTPSQLHRAAELAVQGDLRLVVRDVPPLALLLVLVGALLALVVALLLALVVALETVRGAALAARP